MMMTNDDVAGSGDQRGMLMKIFDLAIAMIKEEEKMHFALLFHKVFGCQNHKDLYLMDVMCKKISVVRFGDDGAVVITAEVLEACRI